MLQHWCTKTLVAVAVFTAMTFFTIDRSFAASSHLGQPIGKHVTLRLMGSSSPDACQFGAHVEPVNFFRLFPNGTVAANRFKVPNGKFLIITDIYWEGAPRSTPGSAGTSSQLHLWYLDNTDPFFRSTPVANSVENETALVGGSDHLIAGLRIGPGKVICGRITDSDTSGSVDRSLGAVFLHGYLTR